MGLHHRKLIPEICGLICHVEEDSCSSDCKVCLKVCLTNPYSYYSPPPPQPPPQLPPFYLDEDEHHGKHHKISTYLILTVALLAAAFFAVCCHAIYTRFFSRRRASSRQQQTQETRDDFLDEEHGPVAVVDHPIWYIRTPGLRESIISAITVCKYKKGEGLIEGTECSVCLSEFQEEESLRLLPKCHHAFHLPCIDTWLRSHTNCPMCRAPIVTIPARIPSLEPSVVDSSSLDNTQMELLENSGQTSGGMENSAHELSNRAEEEGQLEVEDGTRICETESPVAVADAEVVSIRPRRSVSLDSSFVANINLALATVESDGNSNRVLGDVNEPIVSKRVTGNENLPTTSKGSSSSRTRYLQSVPCSMKRSRSYNGKYILSWYSRSQKKPNAPVRSF